MKEYLEIGQIVGTHGIKGFVKVKPLTDDISRFNDLKSVYMNIRKSLVENSKEDFLVTEGEVKGPCVIRKELIEFIIEDVKYHKNMVMLKLKGIDTIEKAEEYRNIYLQINRKDSVKLPKGSYFIVDLLECNVYTDEGEELGKLDDVFNTGSNDIYVVKTVEGKQILLPAIKDVIKEVDVENKKIIVKLIEGLV